MMEHIKGIIIGIVFLTAGIYFIVVAGIGLQLFENITERTLLELGKTKVFKSGAIILYYNLNHA